MNSSLPLRQALSWTVIAVTFLIPPLAWLISSGDPRAYFEHHVPPGQTLFVASKLCALMALSFFWLQCMTALARTSPALRGFLSLTRRQHAVLGCATFAVVVLHAGLFVIASTLRTQHVALDLFIPTFVHGYYRTNISLGAIGFWLLVLALGAGLLRLRQGAAWKWVHRLVFAVFALGFLHGISIGSETRLGLMKYAYAFIGLSIGTALCSWVWHAWGVRHQARLTGQEEVRSATSDASSLTE